MMNENPSRATIEGYSTLEIHWRCVDIEGLRKAFASEGEGLPDDTFARDAWDNGVREPYFKVEEVWM
jgi:hypothetical protein